MKNIKEIKEEIPKVNDAIFNILSYYTCPPECHAFCCKQYPIDLTDKDYNKLRRLSPEKADKSRIVKYGKSKDHQLEVPCSFLGADELCTAYNIRPERCHTFPFNVTDRLSSNMQIYPCMMGKKASKDYCEYKIYTMKKNNDMRIHQAKLEIATFLRDLDERSKSYYLSKDPNETIPLLGIPFNEIYDFSDYLNDMKTVRK